VCEFERKENHKTAFFRQKEFFKRNASARLHLGIVIKSENYESFIFIFWIKRK